MLEHEQKSSLSVQRWVKDPGTWFQNATTVPVDSLESVTLAEIVRANKNVTIVMEDGTTIYYEKEPIDE